MDYVKKIESFSASRLLDRDFISTENYAVNPGHTKAKQAPKIYGFLRKLACTLELRKRHKHPTPQVMTISIVQNLTVTTGLAVIVISRVAIVNI